jgi:hypothetical protein
MTDASTPALLLTAPMTVTVLRETVPVAALTEFVDRAVTTVPSVLAQQGLEPGPVRGETSLTEPTPDGDPADLLTQITWPLAR